MTFKFHEAADMAHQLFAITLTGLTHVSCKDEQLSPKGDDKRSLDGVFHMLDRICYTKRSIWRES